MNLFKNIIIWIVIFAVVLVIQTTMLPKIAILGIYPDLVFLTLFVLALQNGVMGGIWGGFVVGLLIDVFSGGLLGTNAFAKTIIGGMSGFFEKRNMSVDPIILLIFLLLALIFHDIIIYIFNIYAEHGSIGELPKLLFFNTLPRAIYTVFVATALFIIVDLLIPLKSRR